MDEKHRCGWVSNDPLYIDYHDNEWGKPIRDDAGQFEFLVLESFQAGLSWITILKKRENFREAFDHFDYKKIANYSEDKVHELMQNEGIIRNEKKIRAAINNAQRFMEIQQEFGSFTQYLWGFTNGDIVVNTWDNYKDAPATTTLSDTVSKDLKKRGFKFLGSTTVYAHLQATGIVNDHEKNCFLSSQ